MAEGGDPRLSLAADLLDDRSVEPRAAIRPGGTGLERAFRRPARLPGHCSVPSGDPEESRRVHRFRPRDGTPGSGLLPVGEYGRTGCTASAVPHARQHSSDAVEGPCPSVAGHRHSRSRRHHRGSIASHGMLHHGLRMATRHHTTMSIGGPSRRYRCISPKRALPSHVRGRSRFWIQRIPMD